MIVLLNLVHNLSFLVHARLKICIYKLASDLSNYNMHARKRLFARTSRPWEVMKTIPCPECKFEIDVKRELFISPPSPQDSSNIIGTQTRLFKPYDYLPTPKPPTEFSRPFRCRTDRTRNRLRLDFIDFMLLKSETFVIFQQFVGQHGLSDAIICVH